MKINKLLTQYNHNSATADRIQYLVIHYVGALGSAKANCQWYAGGNRGASAHYFVDFDGAVWQSVEDQNIAWHCGAKSYRHPKCRNANSIGIEMCVRNKGSQADTSRDWYFEDATVLSTIQLTKELMKKYAIPAGHVIRHHDVTGKICPNPYVYNQGKHTWNEFKSALSGQTELKSGWMKDENGWCFYLGDTGNPVRNDWHKDHGGRWSWFDASGYAVWNTWHKYEENWYWFGPDCYLYSGQWITDKEKQYYLTSDGEMARSAYIKSKDPGSNMYYWVNEEGVYEPQWDTAFPNLNGYILVE